MTLVLLVCMGNICRSPMAEVVATKLTQTQGLSHSLQFASAGTHAQPLRADPRTQTILKKFGYPESKKRAVQVRAQDFERFDLILAMDSDNLRTLQKICPQEQAHKLRLFLECAERLETDQVPDPYYGNLAGFERVLGLCEAGAQAWIKRLTAPGYTR